MATSSSLLETDGPARARACPACGGTATGEPLLSGRDRLVGNPERFGVVRCGSCGLAFTTPRVSAELERYYPPSYPSFQAPRGARGRARAVIGATLNKMRLAVGVRRGPYRHLLRTEPGRLLDVGCGGGLLGEYFLRRGWDVAGIEPSAHGAERAAQRGIEVHRGTLEDAAWPAASFDAVIFNHSLEHMPDPVDALARARRLLREGGLLGVSVPNFGCWQRRAFADRWFQLDLPRHLQHFERDTLAGLLAGAGLDVVEVRTQSMLAGLSGSVQYALFGRYVLHGGVAVAATYASVPLLAVLDLLGQGDCLGAVARR